MQTLTARCDQSLLRDMNHQKLKECLQRMQRQEEEDDDWLEERVLLKALLTLFNQSCLHLTLINLWDWNENSLLKLSDVKMREWPKLIRTITSWLKYKSIRNYSTWIRDCVNDRISRNNHGCSKDVRHVKCLRLHSCLCPGNVMTRNKHVKCLSLHVFSWKCHAK